jgi:lysine decarboxylase/arginine decarboxylase
MEWYKYFSILIIDDALGSGNAEGRELEAIKEELEQMDFKVIGASSERDGWMNFTSRADICCVLQDWDMGLEAGAFFSDPTEMISRMRERNGEVPIFIITEKLKIRDIPAEVISRIDGYVWKLEDTPDFIAGRMEQVIKGYVAQLLPPFFKELVRYVDEYKYAWHTPGHTGGVAFLKSPAGRPFFQFFGENTLRSDLSVSVPELGSLLEHSEVVGEAESKAAKAFGADRTYFVTNGTSTANKIVWHGCVTPGDIVLVDRNCHKSLQHAITMTGAIPIYFIPTRNEYGIIGPIPTEEFAPATITRKIKRCPLIKLKAKGIKLAVVTNSTYDGLCYGLKGIEERLKGVVDNLHFDEAWYGYARFHPLYQGRFGMSASGDRKDYPAIFSTQSTHKVLAAFSQGSMIHVRSGRNRVEHDRFNEAFMMHTSTSPQYGIIASLDVATRMMQDKPGRWLIDDTIEEAIFFRKDMVKIGREIDKRGEKKGDKWWFDVWQPDKMAPGGRKQADMLDVPVETQKSDPSCWTLKAGERWHGFKKLEKDYIMLDPTKVTILTPGIKRGGGTLEWGIPADIVSRFLRNRGVVVEKTGNYSFLVLFTIGITKGKSGTLLAELFAFKKHYDEDASLEDVFPELVEEHPDIYGGKTLQQLCADMHAYYREEKITEITEDVYNKLPEQEMTPAEAYVHLVKDEVEQVAIKELMNKVSAVMVVPYPPGIPVIMPGEKYTTATKRIVDYLALCEEFDNRFPGFENEMHGVDIKEEDGRKTYYIYCIK